MKRGTLGQSKQLGLQSGAPGNHGRWKRAGTLGRGFQSEMLLRASRLGGTRHDESGGGKTSEEAQEDSSGGGQF